MWPGQQPPAGGGGRTKAVAITDVAAVVVAAGVTGFLLIGGGDDPTPAPTASPTTSASANPRSGDGPKPTVSGRWVVANPGTGIAFDVPPEWAPQSADLDAYAVRDGDEDDVRIAMKAPAVLEEKWCTSDADRDGTVDCVPSADTGSGENNGAKSPRQISRSDSAESATPTARPRPSPRRTRTATWCRGRSPAPRASRARSRTPPFARCSPRSGCTTSRPTDVSVRPRRGPVTETCPGRH